jgi:hypothetical protein
MTDQKIRIVKKRDLRKALKENLKVDSRRITTLINNFVDIGVLKVTKEGYEINEAKPPFLKVPFSTVNFCLANMNNLSFKIYCVLLNMYKKHCFYGRKDNYFFTKKELLESIGYVNASRNLHIVDEALIVLKELDLIDYTGPKKKIDKNGKQSMAYYFELLNVNLK